MEDYDGQENEAAEVLTDLNLVKAIGDLEIDRIPMHDARFWVTKEKTTVSNVIKRLYEEIMEETCNTQPSDAVKLRLENATHILKAID